MKALVVAEHEYGELKPETAKTLSAAHKVGADIDVLLVGENLNDAAEQASKLSGVSRVLVADSSDYAHQLAENTADLIVSLAGDYSHLFASATTTGKNIMPRVAALLDKAQVSDIIDVIDADTFKRPIYAGNAIATVKSLESVHVITVRASAFDAVSSDGSASIEKIDNNMASTNSEFVSKEQTESEFHCW